MKMQRYFVDDNQIKDNRIWMTDGDYHHISHVMRCKRGDELIVTGFSGVSYLTEIVEFTKKEAILQIKKRLETIQTTLNISLAQALIKRDAFELVLQKTTELGVKEIYPLSTRNSIVKIDDFSKKKARYQAIVKEASEQSERDQMPIIHDLHSLQDLPFNQYDIVLIAFAREESRNLNEILSKIHDNQSVLILIGPEGGFTDAEIEYCKSKGTLISLGNTILRSETAAIFAISVFRFLRGN